jgi:hypothetical protein
VCLALERLHCLCVIAVLENKLVDSDVAVDSVWVHDGSGWHDVMGLSQAVGVVECCVLQPLHGLEQERVRGTEPLWHAGSSWELWGCVVLLGMGMFGNNGSVVWFEA